MLALLQSEARYDVSRMKGATDGLRDALLFPEPDATIDQQPYVAGHEDLIQVPVETRVSGALRSLQRRETRAVRRAGLRRRVKADDEEDGDQTAAAVIRSERRTYEGALSRSGIDQLAVLAGIAGDGGGRRRPRSSGSRAPSTTSESAITAASAFPATPRWWSGGA